MRFKILAVCLVVLLAGNVTMVSADLLGVSPGYPEFAVSQSAVTAQSYNATSHQFTIDNQGSYVFIEFADGSVGIAGAAGADSSGQVQINISVDNSGNLIGPSTDRDLVIRGTVTDPNDGSITYTDDLITGSITAFGYLSQDSNTAVFDFRFTVTGGSMANYPGISGQDMGAMMTVEETTFDGTFASDFSGFISGGVGPIAPVDSGTQSIGIQGQSPANKAVLGFAAPSGVAGRTFISSKRAISSIAARSASIVATGQLAVRRP